MTAENSTDKFTIAKSECAHDPLNIEMTTKQRVIEFAKLTVESTPEKPIYYVVEVIGQLTTASNYVQTLRNQLSRFRNEGIANGRNPKRFSLKVISVQKVNDYTCEITIARHKHKPASEIDELFAEDEF